MAYKDHCAKGVVGVMTFAPGINTLGKLVFSVSKFDVGATSFG